MARDIVDALAVEPDLTTISETIEEGFSCEQCVFLRVFGQRSFLDIVYVVSRSALSNESTSSVVEHRSQLFALSRTVTASLHQVAPSRFINVAPTQQCCDALPTQAACEWAG